MIKTTQPVKFDVRNPQLEAIVYAEIYEVIRYPRNKTYLLKIEESIKVEYEQVVPIYDENENQIGTETQTAFSKQVIGKKQKVFSYAESNQLTDYLDVAFQIEETKTERRDRYTVLGHLIVNNQDQVYGTNWELAE